MNEYSNPLPVRPADTTASTVKVRRVVEGIMKGGMFDQQNYLRVMKKGKDVIFEVCALCVSECEAD